MGPNPSINLVLSPAELIFSKKEEKTIKKEADVNSYMSGEIF